MDNDDMKSAVRWQKLEAALVFASSIALVLQVNTELSWWLALLIFFAPDLSFFAYLLGPRVGAIAYNSVHLYGFGAVVGLLGFALANPLVLVVGLLLIAHTGFDRMFGYGLKSPHAFGVTHLGQLGPKKPSIAAAGHTPL